MEGGGERWRYDTKTPTSKRRDLSSSRGETRLYRLGVIKYTNDQTFGPLKSDGCSLVKGQEINKKKRRRTRHPSVRPT